MIEKISQEIYRIYQSEYPLIIILNDIWQLVVAFWEYKIFVTADKQTIAVSNVILGVILFIVGTRAVKRLTSLLKAKLTHIALEASIINPLEKLAHYFLMLLMIIFVLDISNVPLTIFTVVGTTLALGIGLGSQNIVNNFISGIIIMIERPIKIGDIIEIKNITGEVTNIGARCTSIRTSKNINMLIPNSNILQDSIINWTLEDTLLKITMDLQISDNVTMKKVDQLILTTLHHHINILKDPEPLILLKRLCNNGYEIEIEFWIDLASNDKIKYIINDLNREFAIILKKNDIEIIDKALCHIP